MSNKSWFYLELDTTPPTLEIIAPQYTTGELETNIIIQANEQLMEFQEVYIIDNSGTRHDFIFELEETRLVGKVTLSELSSGIAIIYCRLKDDVGNISALTSKSINILGENILFVKLDISGRDISVLGTTRDVVLSQTTQGAHLLFTQQDILLMGESQPVQIGVIKIE